MELSDLHIFRTVVREGGIVRAAQRLHRVPSNITTRIKQLDASIGVTECLGSMRLVRTAVRHHC